MNIEIIKNKSQKIRTRRKNNRKQNTKKIIFIILSLFFLIGILIGAFYFKGIVNNNFFEENPNILKDIDFTNFSNIDKKSMFFEILFKNSLLLILMWIIGLSVLGIPILIFIILYDGFSLGITISYVLNTFGFYEGYKFLYITMYLITLINTGVIILLCNSAVKVTLNILKQKNSIKSEFIRHSILSIIAMFLLIISSILEVFLVNLI